MHLRPTPIFLRIVAAVLLLIALTSGASAAQWVPVAGQVRFNGEPLCAMVLANGQNSFSCSGDGSYQLSVPLDGNGQVTLFSFASGFAPFKQILTPTEAGNFTIDMVREAHGRTLTVTHSAVPKHSNRAVVNGTVSYNGTPICALTLANGQHMFSCGESLGVFNLDVPLDGEHNITLFAFASGSQPYKAIISTPIAPTQPLNDTGIIGCSNANNNNLGCPTANYPGQDAEYGCDVTHNDDSDGHAGFSFTKLDGNGNELPAGAAAWSCVKDNVTGLIWEGKTEDGGLHDWMESYTWYNPDPNSNGGHPGESDFWGDICYGYDVEEPATYCNTHAYVTRVNQAGWCGSHDWRMPSRKELLNIVSRDRTFPSIDADYFPMDRSGNDHWSASPSAYSTSHAWVVGLNTGYSFADSPKIYNKFVRLVRGGQ